MNGDIAVRKIDIRPVEVLKSALDAMSGN